MRWLRSLTKKTSQLLIRSLSVRPVSGLRTVLPTSIPTESQLLKQNIVLRRRADCHFGRNAGRQSRAPAVSVGRRSGGAEWAQPCQSGAGEAELGGPSGVSAPAARRDNYDLSADTFHCRPARSAPIKQLKITGRPCAARSSNPRHLYLDGAPKPETQLRPRARPPAAINGTNALS